MSARGKHLSIHGHFYQPPREDPWMDAIFPEGSAAPSLHWNERICQESYAPLAFARRLDGQGRIIEIMNCYEHISFNFGPTLLTWMERHAPEVYARVLEGDRKSLERLGHGNAIAQIHHHVIMPLASDLDKRAEIAWALADFEARFKRPAEGLWLSEAAVDTRTLELLALAGIRFTILAPRQARQVADIGRDNWTEANEGDLDIRRPYLVELPEGRSIAVYFYDGPLSQAVAFEGLLGHGDRFWGRLSSMAGEGLLALATDGETYGHHFKFGEMALAFALSQARAGVAGVRLSNYATFLAENPPLRRVRIHERSSWSCVHGVERWRADCGCNAEHKPGWNQRWRAPLREGLDAVKARIDRHYLSLGASLFAAPEEALVQYGRVLAGLDTEAEFAAKHFRKRLSPEQRHTAWRLLTMQKWALSSFASCAWFFDDLGRIEPLNALTFCLRAMQIGMRTGLEDLEPLLLSHIGRASSNDPALGSGHDLWVHEVRPRRESTETILAQALMRLWAEGGLPGPDEAARVDWPGLAVEVAVSGRDDEDNLHGRARISWSRESGCDECAWAWELPGSGDPLSGCIRTGEGLWAKCVPAAYLSWGKRQALAVAWARRAEADAWARQLDETRLGAYLFLPYREAQTTQTAAERWTRFWSALAWQWIMGEAAGSSDFLDFLRERGATHPERGLLARRVGEALADLLAEEAPEYAAVKGILERAAQVGVAPDLLQAQNLFWTRRLAEAPAREAGLALGFAPEVLP
jgi:alpha-amylase/alpha-mannosidase (GH57 family)